MEKKDLFLTDKTLGSDEKASRKIADSNMQNAIWNNAVVSSKATVYLKEAKNSEEFVDKILDDEELKNYDAYAELSKRFRPDRHWHRIREMFGNRSFKTDSDMGSVKVANDHFSVLIPNYEGDGTTRVAVFHKNEDFNARMMDFFTILDGKFYIYNSDCANTEDYGSRVEELNGTYWVYAYDGFVAFEEK